MKRDAIKALPITAKTIVVEDYAGWQEVARYVHLNPVRVSGLELHKSARAASRAGLPSGPAPELVAERLRVLREFRWSSYPGYAGYKAPLIWVWREPLARLCGGNNPDEQAAALRACTESAVLAGTMAPPWSRVLDGIGVKVLAPMAMPAWRPSSLAERK